jgi:cytochrome c-type biogenesis protein CcmH/NrfG
MSTKAAGKKILKLLHRLSENPQDIETRLDLGKTYFLNSQFDEAVNCYRALLEKDPRNVSAYYNLAVALLAQKKAQEAKEAFQKVLEIDPNNETAQEELSKLISFP